MIEGERPVPLAVRRLDVTDSFKRCPFDGKRMVMEVATIAPHERHTVHDCLHCGYREEGDD